MLGAGQQHRAELRRAEGDGELGPNGLALDRAGRPVHAGGDVDGHDRDAGARSGSRSPPPTRPRACPRKPVPKIASMATSARASSRRRPCSSNVRTRTPGTSSRRRAFVAAGSRSSSGPRAAPRWSASPSDRAAERPPGRRRRCCPSRRPRPLGGRTRRPRARAPPAPRRGRPAPSARRPRHPEPASRGRATRPRPGVRTGFIGPRSRTPPRSIFSWLKVISTALMPSASARRFAFPSSADRRRAGRMPGDADVQPPAAAVAAERLDRGLAGREPPRVGLRGAGLRVAVRDLLGREDAVAERRVPRDRALDAPDLAEVHPEPDDVHEGRLRHVAPTGGCGATPPREPHEHEERQDHRDHRHPPGPPSTRVLQPVPIGAIVESGGSLLCATARSSFGGTC